MQSQNMFKVFVAHVPWTISKKELKEYFSKFGDIVYSQVLFNKTTGKSKNFGFIRFADSNGYNNAISSEHILENQKLNVYPAHHDASNTISRLNQSPIRAKQFFDIDIKNIMK
ncbi:unnamed protein product [Gordionus sp. m RMFG-2023]|uniref:SRA stem-loop-interacting RNA-binding protein, mitochondrial-like n=1 Tax=Gordionus sp. m RMFG-2023 TaxID=3053472 RepID=UPI0030E2084C